MDAIILVVSSKLVDQTKTHFTDTRHFVFYTFLWPRKRETNSLI